MHSKPHLEEPFPYLMVLFSTPSGYFFLYDWKMMSVGMDLEDFMEGLYDDKQLNREDEECWEEILDDEWAKIEGRQ